VADTVEKVRGIPLECNNRIIRVDFLNRTCAFNPHFESILRRDPRKIFFDSIDHSEKFNDIRMTSVLRGRAEDIYS